MLLKIGFDKVKYISQIYCRHYNKNNNNLGPNILEVINLLFLIVINCNDLMILL